MPENNLRNLLELEGVQGKQHLIDDQFVEKFAGAVVLVVQIEEMFF
jgi:hypothetical protein